MHHGCLANCLALICRHAGVRYHLRQGLPAARSALLRLSGLCLPIMRGYQEIGRCYQDACHANP